LQELSNERTLLAWVRTVLAIMRTAFATLGVKGTDSFWKMVQMLAVELMVLLMVVAAVSALYRYYRLNKVLGFKEIPTSFSGQNKMVFPFNITLVLSVATVTTAVLLHGFVK
jgi:uncharacterized membrane protein YidH (DUF202 family)